LLPPSKLWIRASERSSSRIEHPARRRSPTYEYLDFVHGANVFLNALAGASRCALHQGLISVGAEDHSILIFSELMDSESLFLTANAVTVYFRSHRQGRPRRPRSNGPTEAVEDALRFIETHTLFTRTGPQGIRKVNVRGLVATAFTHPDSLAGDQISIPMSRSRTRVQSLDGQLVGLARLGEQDDGKASLGLT
jgi:TrwC relaxase